MASMNATKLRADLYAVLDSVLETGRPVIIERKGKKLTLSLNAAKEKRSVPRWPRPDPSLANGDPDDITRIDWSREWKP